MRRPGLRLTFHQEPFMVHLQRENSMVGNVKFQRGSKPRIAKNVVGISFNGWISHNAWDLSLTIRSGRI